MYVYTHADTSLMSDPVHEIICMHLPSMEEENEEKDEFRKESI